MTTVVGGTYAEICSEPPSHNVVGSGLRAALTLGPGTRLVTRLDSGVGPSARAAAGARGVTIAAHDRAEPITFTYETHISPAQQAGSSNLPQLEVEDHHVVCFGMVDAHPHVSAQEIVIDPQFSMTTEMVAAARASRTALVCNRRELRLLSGEEDLQSGMLELSRRLELDELVVKGGAIGALVLTGDTVAVVAPVPTTRVNPIGSGDVFTAAFARAWFQGAPAHDAATHASETTAAVCSTGSYALVNVDPAIELPGPGLDDFLEPPTVYVGASFASPGQRWLIRVVEQGLADVGARYFSPLRDVGPRGADPAAVAGADLDAVAASDSILLLADDVRTGPFVEAGWALAHGKPIVVVSSDETPDRFTMLRGSGAVVVPDLASGVYNAAWRGLAARNADK